MIEEEYISFEVAKLLKDKGFDWECIGYYVDYEPYDIKYSFCGETNSTWESICCSAPTLQMAIKWLREEKGIAIIPILSNILDNEKFLWDIKIAVAKTNKSYHQGWIYESYERACETALKYCLENLI